MGFDNQIAMAELTNRVLDMGHRKLAYISGIVDGNDRRGIHADGGAPGEAGWDVISK